ncbi:MAG TPA: hypothetical protein VG294_00955 [Solirubrobacteraceae bacterium]|nr:hypothetical protein [Solirubrobacteraceae bacterium]
MDCFPCSVVKRRVELELVRRGADSTNIAAQVAATRCAMCSEAERQEAVLARRRASVPPASS